MINIKTEKECVMELIKENRPIVEINLKMAKKHIKIKGIKKASKTKKANNRNKSSFLEVFMEEAYKQLRLDGLTLAKEKMELNSALSTEDTDKSICKKDSKKEIDTVNKGSKLSTVDTNKDINIKSTKSIKKTELSTDVKTNLSNKDKVSKNNSCINEEASLALLSETNEKSKKDITHKSKTLNCPPSKNNLPNTELVSPFTEIKRTDGSSQLKFSVTTTDTPIEKTKIKRCKKRSVNNDVYTESTSQLSLFSLM